MHESTAAIPCFCFKPHPITDRDWWDRVRSDPRTAPMIERVLQARREAKPQTMHPSATDYLAARRTNDRARLDYYWGAAGFLVSAAIARCVDGDLAEGSDDELLNAIWLLLTMPTWVLSAHLPGLDLPFTGAEQLDLMACEFAARLAELLEVLKPWIDAQSTTLTRSIVHEIDRRVLTPFVQIDQQGWFDFSPDRVWNNWSGVCAGSILAACESLATAGYPRPAAREKALRVLSEFFVRAFTPAGECDEGIGYWSYGIGMAVLGLSRLDQEELRQRVDMDRLTPVATYPERVHLFDDWFFSGNDATLTGTCPPAATAWLAGVTGSRWLTTWAHQALCDTPPGRGERAVTLRSLDAALRLPAEPPPLPDPAPARFIPDQQAAIFQSDRMHVTLAGGTNAEAHNHNDLGHVNAWVDKQLVLLDMGAPTYTADFFGPARYTYLSASSRGHNCPLINGFEQRPGADAAGKVLALDSAQHQLLLDLTSAYPPEANLRRWTRELRREGAGYDLTDIFELESAGEIENVFWSLVEPRLGPGRISCGPLALHVDPAAAVRVEGVDPKPHRLRQFKDGMLYRIGVRYQAPAATPLEVTTRLSPLDPSPPGPPAPGDARPGKR